MLVRLHSGTRMCCTFHWEMQHDRAYIKGSPSGYCPSPSLSPALSDFGVCMQGSHESIRPGHQFHPFAHPRNSFEQKSWKAAFLYYSVTSSFVALFFSFNWDPKPPALNTTHNVFLFFHICKFKSYINIDMLLTRPTLRTMTMFFFPAFLFVFFLFVCSFYTIKTRLLT